MKIAILGAGALGSVMGGLLAAAGGDIELWDLNDAHIDAINKNGLRIDGPKGALNVNLNAMRPDASKVTPELIILLTKTIHSEAALKGVQRHIDAGVHVLTLQNGLGNAERIANIVPADNVLYGCTMMPGRFIAPGHVASQGDGYAVYKSLTKNGEAFARAAVIETDLLSLKPTQETDQIIWEKAAFNCAMNSACALSGERVGGLAGEQTFAMLTTISAEVVAVANSVGVTANLQTVIGQMEHAITNHTQHKPSMLQDIEAGRQTEIDSLCGYVARLAHMNKISAPLNEALSALISLKSQSTQNKAA